VKSVLNALKACVIPALAAFTLVAAPAHAQSLSNLYAAGVSYNQSASPAVAGSALYAHALSPDTTGMFAFTAIDVLPNGTKPFTVSTNISAGVAEKLFSIAGHDVYVPTTAGVSFTGTNTGWAWSTGAAVPIKLNLKSTNGSWYIVPIVRVLKSSVSNGTGYQPILGVLLGWGK
jgi:hypothetical protein